MPAAISSRIRSIQRALKRKTGEEDAAGREALLTKLQELEQQQKNNLIKEKEKKNATKYHMLKFVERQKICRQIRSLVKKLESCSSEKDKLQIAEKRRELEDDLAYVLYFPNYMRYIALFAGGSKQGITNEGEHTETLRRKARVAALQARNEDIEAGNEDKVLHAINLELGIDVGQRNPPSGEARQKRSADYDGGKGSNRWDGSTLSVLERQSGSAGKGGVGGILKNVAKERQAEKLAPKPGKTAKKAGVEEGLDKYNEKAIEYGGEAFEEVSDVEDEKEETDVEEEKEKYVSMNAVSKKVYEPDSFFLEEAPKTEDGGGDQIDRPLDRIEKRANYMSNKRSAGSSLVLAGRKRKFQDGRKPVSEMTKQELRLAQWQSKKKSRDGRGDGMGGEGFRTAPPQFDKGKAKHFDTREKGWGESRNGSGGGGGGGGFKKNNSNYSSSSSTFKSWGSPSGDKDRNKREYSSAKGLSDKPGKGSNAGGDGAKSISSVPDWISAGGVSAKNSSDMTRMKNTGSILPSGGSKAKKITFD